MSYVSGSGPSGVTKAVISFWFRVPATSINECAAAYRAWQAEDDALHDANQYGKRPPPFNGVIPIMTFGAGALDKSLGVKPPEESPTYTVEGEVHSWIGGALCYWYSPGVHSNTGTMWTWYQDGKFDYEREPSYIGIDCRPPPKDEDGVQAEFIPRLGFNFQLQQEVEVTGGLLEDTVGVSTPFMNSWIISHEPANGPGQADEGCSWPPYHTHGEGINKSIHADMGGNGATTITLKGKGPFGGTGMPTPEMFRTFPPSYPQASKTKAGMKISPDHWHHLLMSFDFSLPVETTGRNERDYKKKPGTLGSACKMWMALDGKNLKKKQISYTWPKGGEDNDLITVMAKCCFDDNVYPKDTGTPPEGDPVIYVGEAPAKYSFTPNPIEITPIGIPCLDQYTDAIRKIEMAELIIFSDASLPHHETTQEDYKDYAGRPKTKASEDCQGTFPLDLSLKENREPFIRSGKPVPATQVATEGNKFKSGAIEFMGLVPDVIFHGTKRWQAGDNLFLTNDGTEIIGAGGPYSPAGDIKAYKPDPSLNGPQGEKSGEIEQGFTDGVAPEDRPSDPGGSDDVSPGDDIATDPDYAGDYDQPDPPVEDPPIEDGGGDDGGGGDP